MEIYTDRFKLIENCQKYLSFGLLILAFRFDINVLFGVSAGLFLGMSLGFFVAWQISLKRTE